MKKLISLVAVFAIIAVSSLGAFAADVDVSTLVAGAEELQKTGDLYEVEADSTTAYATIVAVKGSVIKVGAIQYLNQLPTTAGKATFSFALNDELVNAASAVTDDTKVYVLTGGDGNIAVEGYIETKADDVQNFTISGTVTGFTGAKLPTVVVSDGTTDIPVVVNSDKTFSVSVPEGATYTLTATKTSHLSYTKANITAETTGINVLVNSGDITENGIANIDDMAMIVSRYNAKPDNEEKWNVACDLTEDDILNIDDMAAIVSRYNAKPVSE